MDIDGNACNNIPEAVNKLALSARLGHSCENGWNKNDLTNISLYYIYIAPVLSVFLGVSMSSMYWKYHLDIIFTFFLFGFTSLVVWYIFIIIFSSPWFCWKNAELELSNNHSLIIFFISLIY
jgi:hypothetical protein